MMATETNTSSSVWVMSLSSVFAARLRDGRARKHCVVRRKNRNRKRPPLHATFGADRTSSTMPSFTVSSPSRLWNCGESLFGAVKTR